MKHSVTLTLQRQAAAFCLDLHLDKDALGLMETVFKNSDSIQIEDLLVCVVAHTRLANYDVALELTAAAFQLIDQFEGSKESDAEMQLLYHHSQLMSLQNRWIDAKVDLEACLSSSCVAPTADSVVWNAAAALASATAKCGDAWQENKFYGMRMRWPFQLTEPMEFPPSICSIF